LDLPKVAALAANTASWKQCYGPDYLFSVEKEEDMQGDQLGTKPTRTIAPEANGENWKYFCPLCKMWWEMTQKLENYVEACPECKFKLPVKSKV